MEWCGGLCWCSSRCRSLLEGWCRCRCQDTFKKRCQCRCRLPALASGPHAPAVWGTVTGSTKAPLSLTDPTTSTRPTQTWRKIRRNYNREALANSGLALPMILRKSNLVKPIYWFTLAHSPSKKTKVNWLNNKERRVHYYALFLARHFFFYTFFFSIEGAFF